MGKVEKLFHLLWRKLVLPSEWVGGWDGVRAMDYLLHGHETETRIICNVQVDGRGKGGAGWMWVREKELGFTRSFYWV